MSTTSKKETSKKLIVKILASVVLIGGTFAYFLVSKKNEGEVLSWMSSNWAYRRGIAVSNADGTALTNEDVLIELNTASLITAGKMQNDCDDLRVTDSDTTTSINYWIEGGCNTSATRIWVRIPTLPAIGSTIYFYYGNASAVNAETRWPIYLSFGDGADGDITVSSSRNINTTNSISGRSCADGGDAVNYNVTALSGSTATTATLSSTPSSGCLSSGDEVLLINLQGTSSYYTNVGNHEIMVIDSISTNTITFTTLKTKYYGNGASDDTNIGTSTSNQRVMLQRIPNYNDITVNSGYSFYPSAWNGTKGGVMMFKANGTVTVNGTITTVAKGYRGGIAGTSSVRAGAGETYIGYGSGSGGRGAKDYLNGIAGNMSGGGGAGAVEGVGVGSLGSGGIGGSGGGGGYGQGTYYYLSRGGSGGGGGYGTYGIAGVPNAVNGSTNISGAGGGGRAAGAPSSSYGGGGGGGGTYGIANLSRVFLGSGGGGGGGAIGAGGTGGIGGGIIYISTNSLVVGGTGSVTSTGGVGGNSQHYGEWSCGNERNPGGAGGAAGGSVYIVADMLSIGTSLLSSTGGAGGYGVCYNGGAGGSGRIRIEYITSASGTTNPSASTEQLVSSQSTEELSEERYNQAPTAPTNLYTEGSTTPTRVTDLTPEFSAVFNDADSGDTGNYYQIQVNSSSAFTGTVMWDSNTIDDSYPNFSGWSSTSTSSCGSTTMMGGYNIFGVGSYTQKTIPNLPAGTYMVSFNYYHVDSWDGESGRAFWNGTQIWSRAHTLGGTQVCGGSWGDSVGIGYGTTYVVVSHTGGDATLKFDSTLDQAPNDESWGVNNIKVVKGMTPTAIGARSPDISYAGTTLEWGTTYYWRIKFWDSDDAESPWSATANFTMNNKPNTPTSLLTEGSTNPIKTSLTPYFSAIFSDDDATETGTHYQVLVNTASDFTGTTMWDSTKTAFGTPVTNGSRCSNITYAGSALDEGITYYWKIKFWDVNNLESEYSEVANFLTGSRPSSPTGLLFDGRTNPTYLLSTTPDFSAIYSDINGDSASAYQINVNTSSLFTGDSIWDSGKQSMTIISGQRSSNITYAGTALVNSKNIYYWRIRFWDTDDMGGEWSATAQFIDSTIKEFWMEGISTEGINYD